MMRRRLQSAGPMMKGPELQGSAVMTIDIFWRPTSKTRLWLVPLLAALLALGAARNAAPRPTPTI
jgi:hypothetical protein